MASRAESKNKRVFVIGVGMTKFLRTDTLMSHDYPDLVYEAVTKALSDAKINYNEVEQACIGYVYGDSASGQRALYEVGMSGIPIYNVHNYCATGTTAMIIAKQLIEGGISNCILAVGFEKMPKGTVTTLFDDRTNPIEKHIHVLEEVRGFEPAPVTIQIFGSAGREHMEKYGTTPEHFAKIAEKNYRHSINNPYSQLQDEFTVEQILSSPMIYDPLTKLQCCPTSDGAAAAVIVSEDFVHSHGLESQAVEILGMVMATDEPSTFDEKSCIKMAGFDVARKAAEKLYQKTNLSPKDVDVVELHDCFSTNELITYEALGLCDIGKGAELVDSGNNTYGGKYVVNPSGGLISKGHPLGATGIAQCVELSWQLRHEAGLRQVPGAQIALQHNQGLGGAVVVALYKLGFPASGNATSYKHSSLRYSVSRDVSDLMKPSSSTNANPPEMIIHDDVGEDGTTKRNEEKLDLFSVPTKRNDATLIQETVAPINESLSGKVKLQGTTEMIRFLDLRTGSVSKL